MDWIAIIKNVWKMRRFLVLARIGEKMDTGWIG